MSSIIIEYDLRQPGRDYDAFMTHCTMPLRVMKHGRM